MKIARAGAQPSSVAADTFTGRVRRDPLLNAEPPGRVLVGSVTFEPGARTDWHVHPLGQLLIVTAGAGWVQVWDGERQTVRAGDTVWFAAHEKHWHGATATTAMTHVAITEALDGSAVTWLEKVAEDQYLGPEPAGERA